MTEAENNLGRLEPVDLRGIWKDEAADFTPWLTKAENLNLLADAIGIELQCEAQEKDVGPFRADMLCRETGTDDWVVIENQLECTNHDHLGKSLTYAAGLGAKPVIWIARKFTDEHRAALDWLNEIAGGSARFFGVEIELWRIAGSATAPKFNIVCRPNASSAEARKAAEATMSELQAFQRDYWAGLRDLLVQRNSTVKPRKPQPRKSAAYSIGRKGFWLYAGIEMEQHLIEVAMSCNGDEPLRRLQGEKESIEREIGCALKWAIGTDADEEYECFVGVSLHADPANRDEWGSQHLWLADTLEAFHRAFAPRIRALDLDGEGERGQE